MKHNYLLFGAVALLAVVACEKEAEKTDELTLATPEAEPSPDYDPETETVKAEFVLNISTTTGKDTKTTAEFVQMNGEFLGLDNAHLLTYALPYGSEEKGNFFYRPIFDNNPVAASRDFNLGSLFPENSVTSSKASRTLELSLPLGTNAVVMYGKAKKSFADDIQGKVSLAGDPNDLTTLAYSLCTRMPDQNAYDAGTFVFSRIFNYLLTSGLVKESTFWTGPTGSKDRSYAFWFPTPPNNVTLPDVSSTDDGTEMIVDGDKYTCYKGQLAWKQLGRMFDYMYDNYDDTVTDPNDVVKTESGIPFEFNASGEALGEAYSALTTVRVSGDLKELRAGSAISVLHTIEDLHSIVERVKDADPMRWEEQAVKLLAEDLEARISVFFAHSTDGGLDFYRNSDGSVKVDDLLANLETRCSPNEWNTYQSILAQYFKDSYFPHDSQGGFPVNIDLPFGAAIINIEKGTDNGTQLGIDRFYYITSIPAYGLGGATFPIYNYRYPAELMYYGNSPIRVSNDVKKGADYPASVQAWDNEDQWTSGWTAKGTVLSSTRSVAMINNINYGTALLASTAKFGTGVTKLFDNNAALHPGEDDQEITVSTSYDGGLLVTGIVVAGQADVVGWDYTRYPDNGAYGGAVWDDSEKKFKNLNYQDNPFDKIVYDRVYTPFAVGSSNTIYTMLWDNYDATKPADEQSDVYIGLELVNNTGEDFWGEMNLVRNGSVFYLVGKLNLSDAIQKARESNDAAFSDLDRDYYCYPPFNPTNGKTINAPRVLMQDYVTTANLVFGTDCLKHAYVTVPDLRSSQVSLGVSVDMTWTPGLAFDVNMGVLN